MGHKETMKKLNIHTTTVPDDDDVYDADFERLPGED